ncbi:MAG: hypothetical protein ACJ76V_00855 [Thermoleophilaceae bacterium]
MSEHQPRSDEEAEDTVEQREAEPEETGDKSDEDGPGVNPEPDQGYGGQFE